VIWHDTNTRARLFGIRTVLRVLARTGDPGARLMALEPAEDPYPVYALVRSRGDLVSSKLNIRLTASHALCQQVLRDNRFGVAPIGTLTKINFDRHAGEGERRVQPVDDSFLTRNPPEHTRLRKLAAPWFTPRSLRLRQDAIKQAVTEQLDLLARRSEFDVVNDFAVPVAMGTITRMLGVGEVDQPKFVWWGMTLAGTLNGVRTMTEVREVRQVLAELEAFFAELIAYRREQPGDDLVSELIKAEVDGRPLGERDLLATAELLFVAGFETMVNLVGNAVVAVLGSDRARQQFLTDLDRSDDVVEEALRIDSPVQYVARVANETVELGGHTVAAGSTVVLLIGAANRDPVVFADPDRFDIGRANNREHLAFSAGIHFCLGAGLARVQAGMMLKELFGRFPDMVHSGPIRRRPSRNIRGVINLPVRAGASRKVPS
jgi:cytochrome P450